MKRDMELIREILFTVENQYKPGEIYIKDLEIQGYEKTLVAEHCDLLYQQGFIKSYKIGGRNPVHTIMVSNLTSSGYDYLELIRNETIWNKTKSEIESKQIPQTFEAIAKIAGIFVGNVIDQMKG